MTDSEPDLQELNPTFENYENYENLSMEQKEGEIK